jgi:hypothetical protein
VLCAPYVCAWRQCRAAGSKADVQLRPSQLHLAEDRRPPPEVVDVPDGVALLHCRHPTPLGCTVVKIGRQDRALVALAARQQKPRARGAHEQSLSAVCRGGRPDFLAGSRSSHEIG